MRRAFGPLLLLLLWAPPSVAHEGAEARSSALDQLIALSPAEPAPWLRRAEERRRQGDLSGATADLARASELGAPARPLSLERALIALARADFRGALDAIAAAGPGIEDDASLLEARAVARHALGLQGACPDRLAALTLRPDTPRALAAEEFCIEGDPAGLRSALDEAEGTLGIVPQLREALIRSCIAAGDLEAASSLAAELTRDQPTRVAGWLLAAEVEEARGAHDHARDRRAAAVALAQERLQRRGTPLHRLAYAEALAASSRFVEAASQLDEVLRSAPDLPGAVALARTLESP